MEGVQGAAVLSPVCWREQRGGVEAERGTQWPQDGKVHTGLRGGRDGEAQCERAWAFQGGEKPHS